eukprot:5191029-Amphidinium_carterae.1
MSVIRSTQAATMLRRAIVGPGETIWSQAARRELNPTAIVSHGLAKPLRVGNRGFAEMLFCEQRMI